MKFSEKESEYLYGLEKEIADNNIYKMVEWAAFYHYNHPEMVTDEIAEKIYKYYKKGIENGISLAYLNLGAMYYSGVFIERDFRKALKLYTMAAESNDEDVAVKAICNLGYCFYYGRDIDVDYEKAFNYFLRGALIYNDPNCLYKLGDMYRFGNFVKKDEKTAFELYNKSYENCYSDNECYADICKRLGEFYLYGIATEKDLIKAVLLLSEAESHTYEKIYKRDAFAKNQLSKIVELLTETKQEILKETLI